MQRALPSCPSYAADDGVFTSESKFECPLRITAVRLRSAERFAVQLQARRRTGPSILHRCLGGGIDSCTIGLQQR